MNLKDLNDIAIGTLKEFDITSVASDTYMLLFKKSSCEFLDEVKVEELLGGYESFTLSTVEEEEGTIYSVYDIFEHKIEGVESDTRAFIIHADTKEIF